ncbi:MAG: (d)CMP kinase [Deltaproteobacteria bacterium]|nr:(d)CMP kinase [Deltaproteobacteria bacterium]
MSAETLRRIVIAIDGPAGAGKSTIAKQTARELGYTYVDTGAMYRATGLLARERGVPLDDAERLGGLTADLEFGFPWVGEVLHTVVDGRDVSHLIRTPEAALDASTVSKVPAVRAALMVRQRAMAAAGGVVMEGRDIGTVVFPDAELKVFLTASSRVRGERRWKQMRDRGDTSMSLDDVITDIERRDHQDSTRAVAPLRPAEDSVVLDTSKLGVGRVRQTILRLVAARQEDPDVEITQSGA